MMKKRGMRMEERVSTFCGVLLQQTRGKTSPPRICSIFRVLELKSLKVERGAMSKKRRGRRLGFIYSHLINEGRQYKYNRLR
jgi:hypothetical protein